MRAQVSATHVVAGPLSRRVLLPVVLGCCAAALLCPPAATAAIADGANAIDALGQYDDNVSAPSPVYTKSGVNNSPNQFGLNAPYYGIALDGANDRLFVADMTNNRVVVYNLNADDTLIDRIADAVLGQPNLYTNTSATTQAGLASGPYGLALDTSTNRLFVSNGHRVTVYNLADGLTNGENAINVLGQTNFTNNSAATTQSGLNWPRGLHYSNNRLYVSQNSGARIMIFDVTAIANGENAADLLGQYDDNYASPSPIYTKSVANDGPNKFGFNSPEGNMVIDSADDRLFVNDQLNQRVLVYNLNADDTLIDRIPDAVLGQANFYSGAAATTQAGMNGVCGLAYDSTNKRLFVSQITANRVTVYNLADGITNGENAINVLGQANFTSSSAATTQAGLNTPYDTAYDGTNSRLFVSQITANRVTVYNLADGITNGENAINVLGQANFTSSSAATTQAGMNAPRSLAYDSTNNRLFVPGLGNHRVTVYNLADGITDGENAINVLGQANFTTGTAATTQVGMNAPYGIAYDGTNSRLFVSQTTANRVTVYNLADGITDGENAVNVLGQANFTSISAANTQAGMNAPRSLVYDSTNSRLFVGQYTNHRVTVYNLADGITNGENAIDCLGQYDDNLSAPSPAYTKSAANNGPNKLGLDIPEAPVWVDGANDRLFVSDSNNHRVLVYNLNADDSLADHIPDAVLGQANFYSNAGAATQSGMWSVSGFAYDNASTPKRLFVSDGTYHRVMVYDVDAITNGENAINVLGQSTFTASSSATTQVGLSGPRGLWLNGSTLFVVQSGNHRISIFDVAAISNGENAVNLLGQYDDANYSAPSPIYTKSLPNDGPNKFGLSSPSGVAIDTASHRLFVSDTSNNRVLVHYLEANDTLTDRLPDAVLGQANFTTGTAATTQAGMNGPYGIVYDSASGRLFVAQATAHRVTVYNAGDGITNGESAVNVLGEANFTTGIAATTQAGMNNPRDLAYDSANQRLFVGQSTGNRVTVYNLADGIANGENAINVLGQANFTTATGATTQAGMNAPWGLFYDSANSRLFVTGLNNHRVTVYNLADGITDGENAINVLGQSTFTAGTSADTQAGMSSPRDVVYDSANNRLFVAQTGNHRVTVYNLADGITDGENAINVLGQANFTTGTAAFTQAGMVSPYDASYDPTNKRLYVVGNGNHRVTIYDVEPASADTSGFLQFFE